MKKIVVFTGAGVSADSGISTFRDSDGLWANHRIEDVCTPEALKNNRETVINFYNIRRKELLGKKPNPAHEAIVALESKYKVEVITQNIDDLHERAGSTQITHLHGELKCLRSSVDPNKIYPIANWDKAVKAVARGASIDEYSAVWGQDKNTKAGDGSLLRPYVVFFGEAVPNFELAIPKVKEADILIVVGTSLAVYPAAALAFYAPSNIPVYVVDPNIPDVSSLKNPLECISERAAIGMPILVKKLLA